MGKSDPGDFHPIMNEWGRAWTVPSQVRVVRDIPRQTYMSPKLFLLLACLKLLLRDNSPKNFFFVGLLSGDIPSSVSASS
jgi:hypothetical protein